MAAVTVVLLLSRIAGCLEAKWSLLCHLIHCTRIVQHIISNHDKLKSARGMIFFHHDISHMKPMTWGNRSMEPHLSRLISSMAQRRTYSHAPDDDNRTRTRGEHRIGALIALVKFPEK